MQTKLEKRLRHLNIPAPSQNLRDRCFDTIPIAYATQNAGQGKTARPLKLQRTITAGALLFASIAGVAFFTTRPPINGKSLSSSSVAFAQVLEAARHVQFVHAKGRQVSINIDQKGWYSSDWRRGEAWFDAEKGLYTEDSSMETPSPSLRLAKGTSAVSRMLLLTNGALYNRAATSSTLRVESRPEQWRRIQNSVTALLVGASIARTAKTAPIGFNDQDEPKMLSSTTTSWKDQAARLLVFEQQPSSENAVRGAPVVQAHFYIRPETNLVIARQDFAVLADNSPRLVAEYEFDYTRPDPALFDPAPLKIGADIHEDEKPAP